MWMLSIGGYLMEGLGGTEATGTLIAALESKKTSLWQSVFTWAVNHPPRYPWRQRSNPYDVLIGELLLEKARTTPVIASERFLHVFPSVEDLLAAGQEEINRVLEHLHLQRHRQSILGLVRGLAIDGKGDLPGDSETLARVSGLERHHIRAVFCFGYGLPLAVVDGHVRRMLRRIFARSLPGHSPIGLLETVAESLVCDRDPQTYNGVLLDLAEVVCRTELPWCQDCPLIAICDSAPGFRTVGEPPAPSSHRSLVKTGEE
jgi:A/G-specific adenine glycosylase